jgi:hypothetical protein
LATALLSNTDPTRETRHVGTIFSFYVSARFAAQVIAAQLEGKTSGPGR